VAEVLPLPCAMELIKGRKVAQKAINEERLRYPTNEEVWEVSCDGAEEDRPALVQTSRSLRRRSLDSRRDFGFAYQS
jgi:hypothetical protein